MYPVVKRVIDILASGFLLLLLLPLFVVVAVLIKLGSSGPAVLHSRSGGLQG